jgi:hypothetical protein
MSESPNLVRIKKGKIVKKLIIINDEETPTKVQQKTNERCLDNNMNYNNMNNNNNDTIMHTLLEKYALLNEKYLLLEEKMTEMGKLITAASFNNNSSYPAAYADESFGKKQKGKRQTTPLEMLRCAYPFRTNNFNELNHYIVAEFNRQHLKLLFNNKFEEGYTFILLDLLNSYSKKYAFDSVRAFNAEPNQLYIFSAASGAAEPEWMIWTTTAIMETVNKIYKQIITEFAKWQNEILHKMKDDDDLANEYATQVKKVFVNPASKENFCGLISKRLYKYLKSDLS